MINRDNQYRLFKISCWLLLVLALTTNRVFSQEKDYPVTEDTTETKEEADTGVSNAIIEARDKAEDSIKKSQYNFYYNRDEWTKDSFFFRQVPDSIIKRLQAQDDFWYANKDFDKKKEAVSRTQPGFWNWLSRQQWYKAVAWIFIVGGFVTVLIWFLASSNVGIFRRRSKTVAEADTGEMTENIFEIDYTRELEKATQSANYRLAIRLFFLRLLKTLSEKNIIEYKQGKTNFDYLAQLNSTGYYNDFFRLTRDYEYTWYGEFAVSPEIFTIIKNDFEKFDKQLD